MMRDLFTEVEPGGIVFIALFILSYNTAALAAFFGRSAFYMDERFSTRGTTLINSQRINTDVSRYASESG